MNPDRCRVRQQDHPVPDDASVAYTRSAGGRAERILEPGFVMTTKNVAIEDPDLLERYAEIARSEGKTVDELTTEAVKRDVARRWLDKNKREAQLRRGNMTEDEVEAVVGKAIQESRAEQRGR
jgi:hypothetical protein